MYKKSSWKKSLQRSKNNGEMVYHLEDNLPPITGNVCEKLEKINDADNSNDFKPMQ